jgi:MerR family transcriptional regulator, redox-sensitive transcriptional activator SoxR
VDQSSLDVEADFKSSAKTGVVMTISEVARRAGVQASAIRYYERLGVLPAPKRAGGRRRYDESVLDALAIIRFAKHVGFSLTETKALLAGRAERPNPEHWRALARGRLRDVESTIAEAEQRRRLLQDALRHECPKLVERGNDLTRPRA